MSSTSGDGSTTHASTTSTSSSGDSDGTTGCSFLGCDDSGDDSPCGPCDLDACAEGEKCNMYSADTGSWYSDWGCFPMIPDPGDIGDPCDPKSVLLGIDSCGPHATCYPTAVDEAYCFGLCEDACGDRTCAAPGTWCYLRDTTSLCVLNCDPRLGANACGGERQESCVPAPGGDGYACVPDMSGDAGGYADPCTDHNECDPGFACAPGDQVGKCEAPSCCTPFCDADEPNTCPGAPDEICQLWYAPDEAPPSLQGVGVCALP